MKQSLYLAVLSICLLSQSIRAQFGPAEILSQNWCGTPIIARGADIDGDGDTDLCTASHEDGLLRWLENGDGYGDMVAPHALGGNVSGVTDLRVADMDDDGDIDRVTCSDVTNDILWSANDGAGNFGAGTVLAAGVVGLNSLELVDLDQDGDLDVLATAEVADSVVWVPNNGGGGFGAASGLCGQLGGAHDVAVADFDGDGDLDLALSATNENQPIWAENDGAEVFTIHLLPISAPSGQQFCDVADLDLDGDIDMAWNNTNNLMSWGVNDGTGTFSYGGNIGLNGGCRSMDLHDMDGDGDADVVFTSPLFLAGTELHYITNNGDGTFSNSETLLGTTQSFIRSSLADVDGDGMSDILLASENDQYVFWKRNTGSGTFTQTWGASPPCLAPIGLQHADLDGDGDTDLLVGCGGDGKLNWLANDGAGGFSLPRHITHGIVSLREVRIGDIDGDGDIDALAISQYDSTLAWYANDGSGGFGPQQLIDYTSGYNYCGALDDLNSDGYPDLVTTENNGSRLLVYLNNGDGTFSAPVTVNSTTTTIKNIALGDIDNDADVDIAVAASGSNRIAWFANDGSGAFGAQQTVSSAITQASRIHLRDLNADGALDILCNADNSEGVRMFINTGGGVFGAVQVAAVDNIRAFDAVDMDGDDDIDIAGVDASLSAMRWYANDGTGNFIGSQAVTTPPPYPNLVMAVDLDGDTDPDLVCGSGTADQVFVYESHLGSPFRVKGRLFNDANNSGAYDSGEEPFPFIAVVSAPTWSSPYTTNTGEYTCYLAEGNYNVSSQAPDALWTLTTSPATHNVTLTTGEPLSTGHDFGYVPTGTVNDLIVSLSPLSPGCNGATSQWITWRNNGNTRPSGLVAYTIDPHYTFISAQPGPSSFSGSTLYWTYADLAYYGERTVHVLLQNPDESQIGEPIMNTLAVTIDEDGDPIAVFSDQTFQLVTCAFDPNDKVVDPAGYGEQGAVDVDVPFLEYTVRFQNTGTAPAASVTIRDVLDATLDRASVQLVGSSHTITDMRIEGDGELIFSFDGINLPDSASDEPGSHGFVTFRASPLPSTPSGTSIANTADIYFDLNAPVITNTVSNLLIDCDLFSADITPLTNELLQASTGVIYQWYEDGEIIPGATSQELLVEVSGLYTVAVTNEYGCPLMSDGLQVIITGMNDANALHMVVVPNPMSETARVLFDRPMPADAIIQLLDVNGRIARMLGGNGTRGLIIERGALASGIYTLRVSRNGDGPSGTVRLVLD